MDFYLGILIYIRNLLSYVFAIFAKELPLTFLKRLDQKTIFFLPNAVMLYTLINMSASNKSLPV